MKVAIIGSGALGIEASLHFYQLGAHVVLFHENEQGGVIRRLSESNPSYLLEKEVISENGREFLDSNTDSAMSAKEYWDNYLSKLIDSNIIKSVSKKAKVLRVHKRFLSSDETIKDASRMKDLFRVVYTVSPKETILKQVKENPEVFEKLGKEIIDSLGEHIESYEDFDIVIDATGLAKFSNNLGPSSSPAINELNLKNQLPIHYGVDALVNQNEILKETKKVAIIGDGEISAYFSTLLDQWLLEDHGRRAYIISPKDKIFGNFLEKSNNTFLKDKVLKSIKNLEGEFSVLCDEYSERLHKWRELEDYEKAKVPSPATPVRQLNFYHNYNVTSVDRLLDQKGIFLTIEKPDFRDEKDILETICVDSIIVDNFTNPISNLSQGMKMGCFGKDGTLDKDNEPGSFILGALKNENVFSISQGLKQILDIETEILKYFSKA